MIKNQEKNLCPFLRNQMQSQAVKVFKPIKITNVSSNAESLDILHKAQKNSRSIGCSDSVCKGSIVFNNVASTASRESQKIIEHARDFIDQFFKSTGDLNSMQHKLRMKQIEDQVLRTGTYDLTSDELIFGAKTAWRNAARCIGRIQWNKLKLFDYRRITTAREMFDALCEHVEWGQNGGNLRSAITFFPHRTDPTKDFRIWNSQLVSYAAYDNEDGTITGDRPNLELTKLCMKLGWKPKRTEFDILPMVLSANGNDPELFEYPEGFILEVPINHPKLKWFDKLNLRWYAMPAVANMQMDCGGLIFPGCVFNGWYMSTEIGCRNFCDENRRNYLKPIAMKMGLNTRNPTTLWKDKVLVETNLAVLHSFQKANVTIVDHHTASETFMTHLENENKLRRGCPADWVWIVPPMSASVTRVFHQEMLNYHLRPSFEYQIAPIKSHEWKFGEISDKTSGVSKKIYKYKAVISAVLCANILYRSMLQKRVKATILYATETGNSKNFAKRLVKPLSYIFDLNIFDMSDYDVSLLRKENVLICIVSTTGEGDPPESAVEFLKFLQKSKTNNMTKALDMRGQSNFNFQKKACEGKSTTFEGNHQAFINESFQHYDIEAPYTEKHIEKTRPFDAVNFSVFALGSSAYPKFCAFGIQLDKLFAELGAQRLNDVSLADELSDQNQDFQKWSTDIFKITSDKFKVDISHVPKQLLSMENSNFTELNTRLQPTQFLHEDATDEALSRFHNKNIITCHVKNQPSNLLTKVEDSCVLVEISIDENEFRYEPGDHVAVCPANNTELVSKLLKKFKNIADPDETVRVQIIDDVESTEGKLWQNHSRLPICSIRTIFTRFLDITTTPSRQMLKFLAEYCSDETEKVQMRLLASDDKIYEDWMSKKSTNLIELFDEFPSCHAPIAPLIARLNPLQPRLYSISSSQKKHPDEVHLTVGVVEYIKEGQKKYGICSNYLKNLKANDEVQIYYRKANSFHLPSESSAPMILVGSGTGIAPFRSFWQELDAVKADSLAKQVLLFTGHKTENHELYKLEKRKMLESNILTENFKALSRDPSAKKTYVQDLLLQQSEKIYKLIKHENAHIYICGDSRMADGVHQTFRKIIASQEHIDETSAKQFMHNLKDQSRYHKDTFGAIHHNAEIKYPTLGNFLTNFISSICCMRK